MNTTSDDVRLLGRPLESTLEVGRLTFIRNLCQSLRKTHIIISNKRENNNVPDLKHYIAEATYLLKDKPILEIYKLFKKLGTEPTRHLDVNSVELNEEEKLVYRNLVLSPRRSFRIYIRRKIWQFTHAYQLSQFKRFMPTILPKEVTDYEKENYGENLKTYQKTPTELLAYLMQKSKNYFKQFHYKGDRLGVSNKACVEGKSNYIFTIGTEKRTISTTDDLRQYIQEMDTLYERLKSAVKTETVCKYQQVIEPLKVRSLTKMHSSHQILKGLQESIKSYLDKDPCFQLTNDPDILKAVRAMKWKNDHYFTSGDYSAATDTIHRDAIISVISQIPLDQESRDLLYIGFQNHTIVDNNEEFLLNQKNGQLMGSIISFPILCLINKWIYEYTQELSEEPSSDPLINGDDILFKSSLSFHHEWRKNILAVGFRPSPGKNFVSKINFTINSRPFVYAGARFQALRFINGKVFRCYTNLGEYYSALKANQLHKSTQKSLHHARELGLLLSGKSTTRKQTKFIYVQGEKELGGFEYPSKRPITPLQIAYQNFYVRQEHEPSNPLTTFLKREGYPTYFVKAPSEYRFRCTDVMRYLHMKKFIIPTYAPIIRHQRPYTYTGIQIFNTTSESCAASLQKY